MQRRPYSTAAHLRTCVCLHLAAICGWWASRPPRKVQAMKSLYLPRPSHTCSPATLPPGQPVHTLVIARGHRVRLQTVAGCLWLTCDGALQDWFLPTGHSQTVQGPASLRLGSAHLHAAAEVAWEIRPSLPVWQGLTAAWRRWQTRQHPVACNAMP